MECQFPDAKSSGTEGSVRASENLIAAGRIASSPIIRDRAAREYVRDQGGLIFTARDLRGLASPAQLAPFVDQVRARWEANGQPPLYPSFDIDALDPAYAPGTGTPEPGGLSTAQAFTLLEDLSALPFVGMDCVEVAPVYDHQELTLLAAAQLVWTWLAGRVKSTRN